MSQMKELYEKVSRDAMLQEQFSTIIKDAEKAGAEDTKKKLIAFAKEAGFDVTMEEMQTFFKDLAEKDKGELSNAELDAVAGGINLSDTIFYSIISVGTMCAAASIAGVMLEDSCRKGFEGVFPD